MNQQLSRWSEVVSRWWRDEAGVTAIEYGLLAALIAVVCIGAFSTTGLNLGVVYRDWTSAVIAAVT